MSALRRLAARLVWMVPFAALIATACEHNPAAPGSLARITVTRNPETLAISTTVQFTATGFDANGRVVGINPTWSVVAGGGTILPSGVFTALTAPGTFANTVKATVGSVSGTASVTVTAGPVASITVTPATFTLATNTNKQFTAVLKDAAGDVLTTLPDWSVTAGGGTINGTGMFTSGMAPGTYANTVRASVGGLSGSASVTVDATALRTITVTPTAVVLAQGATQTFTATGKDSSGNVISPLTFKWYNDSATAGRIDSVTGAFIAGNVARTFVNTVRATSGSRSGTASVTVSAGAAFSIVVTPLSATLPTNTNQTFTAVVKDASGNTLSILPNWSVASGGTINSGSGVFTSGMAPGTYNNTVRASVGSVSGLASVTVDATALRAITVTPNPDTLARGATQTFTATGKDSSDNVISPLTFKWYNDSATAGSIDSVTGAFIAGNVARTFANTVRATSGSRSGTATVTVSAGAANSIVVTPTPDTLAIGVTHHFTAVVKDASGNTLAITPNWSVAALGGTITSGGDFTAGTRAGTFANTVTASVGSVHGSATVTVKVGALAVITVTPNPVALAIGALQTFSDTAKDAYGNVISPLTVKWSVVAAGGSIDSITGRFTAGTTSGLFANTVKATSGTVSGFATVAVNADALAHITVTPTPITMAAGVAQQFLAVGRDAHGNVVPILPKWSARLGVGAGSIDSVSGLYVAGSLSPDTVVATSGSISGIALVTITPPNPLAAIVITPNPASLVSPNTQSFTASGRDINGFVVPILPAVTWFVVPSMSEAGTIDSTSGLFTAGNAGTYTNAIQATSGTISGFATVIIAAPPPSSVGPSLGTAANYAVLGSTAVSCIGVSTVYGNVGVAPSGSISGFPAPCVIAAPGDGILHTNDAPAIAAQADVTPAYNALAAMPCLPGNDLSTKDLGGMTLAPGVYCFSSSAQLTGDLHLAGPATGLWVFQVGSALTTGTSAHVFVDGGGLPANVFWQVGTSATLGQTTIFQGNIIAAVSVTMVQGSTLVGRALSKAGVTLDGNTITLP